MILACVSVLVVLRIPQQKLTKSPMNLRNLGRADLAFAPSWGSLPLCSVSEAWHLVLW